MSIKKTKPLFLVHIAAWLLGLSSMCFISAAQAAAVFQELVYQGQERPDKTNSGNATFFEIGCPVIEGDDVVFRSLNLISRAGYDSIWTIKANGAGLRKLVGQSQAVPGGVGTFSTFGFSNGGDYTTSPVLGKGRAVFFATDSNPDPALRAVGGLYSIRLQDGLVKRVANYKTTNPSDGFTKFGQFSGFSQQGCHNAYAFNGNRVFFSAATLGNSDPSGVYQARYDGAGLAKIRDNNDPDIAISPNPRAFYGPTLGVYPKNGATLFGYAGSNVFGPQALYAGKQHLLVRSNNLPGDPSPETGGSAFSYFLFDGNTSVFYANSGADYYGLFSKVGGAPIRKVVSNLQKLPGMRQCPVNVIGNFVADAGRVFFFANTTNCDGLTANGRMGIFMFKDNKIQRIVGIGDKLGDGSSVLEVYNELGAGSVNGNRLVFAMRTTKRPGAVLYVANLL